MNAERADGDSGATADPARLLEGVRVLDFTQYLAGPSCTRLMAELGADIIKVELPSGDPTRALLPNRGGASSVFVQQNRGKRSVVLDMSRPEAHEIVRRLVPHVDLVVENATPGVMEKRGLGYAELSAINPRLIMVSVSGFGQTGSYRQRGCYDFIAQGMAGLMHMTGEPDGPPYFVGIGVGDTNAGVHAFAGVGYALYQRDRTGRGTHIDVSMIDALFHMQEYAVGAASMSGGDFRPIRQGRHYQPVAPAGTFRGPEGWIVILCMPNQLDNLWTAMGRPELASDPRFDSQEARTANRAAMTELIEAWLATFRTDADALAALERHRVPSGPVLNPADAIGHPWFVEQGTVREIHDLAGDAFAAPGFPIRFGGMRPQADLRAAELGQHTREVLSLAGYDDAAVEALAQSGVLGPAGLGELAPS
ncbi:MAG: CoA transferase [Acidimicrobiia bacterium]|nr:CoA transferase [Acidimicrobiia bacterium]